MLRGVNPYLNYLYRKVSKFTLIGSSLLLCALLLFAFDQGYQHSKLKSMKDELAELSRTHYEFEKRKLVNKSTQRIDGIQNLPKRTELSSIFEQIHIAAKQNNIYFENITYKFSELSSIDSISYEVTFPVIGNYLDIRKFISQIAEKNSGVTLQNIELSRENNQMNELDGLFQLAIYVKNK